ncbi:MAG: trypsin-like peptidase domain-containing protein [Planctomycetes bacterium]|nr:trypsin-like peptidase domain-containing protein [Planctomycetota bacterium]
MRLACLVLASCASVQEPETRPAAELPLEDVFERVSGSVVTILTLGPSVGPDGEGLPATQAGVGSGVLVGADGRVLTAAHVVQTAETVIVEFPGGERVPASVEGTVLEADVALVRLRGEIPRGAAVARLGNSDSARVGAEVFVVGAPRGMGHTLTVGHLSARRRAEETSIGDPVPIEILQTDADINPGNSGGPLFDRRGEVIGIVSFILTKSGGSEGLGFAVASNAVRGLLLDRNAFWSGIQVVLLSGTAARLFNLPEGRGGALVQVVAKGSPGARLGLKGGTVRAVIEGRAVLLGGDVILEALGVPVDDPRFLADLRRDVGRLGPEEEIRVEVLRAGKRQVLQGRYGDLVGPR